MQLKQLHAGLNVWVGGEKLGKAHAGKDAVMWILLNMANGSVNWCNPSDFFPSLKSV